MSEMSVQDALRIVREGRAYTVEHFGFSKTSYVGHTPSNEYDRAVDRLVEAVGGMPELVQVGWFCNEAVSHDDRNSLCGHGSPCGPAFVKQPPKEHS